VVIRNYEPDRDKEAVRRIWREVGWISKEKREEEAFAVFLDSTRVVVAELNGAAESAAMTVPGSLRYQEEELAFAGIAGVTTSHIARKQGLAAKLTAHSVARSAADGAQVVGLGMFEQGYYNKLGFGSGSYVHTFAFDPATLTVTGKARVPRRLTSADWEAVHASRLGRWRRHGSCNLFSGGMTRADMLWPENGFGFGYYDGPNGALTHHVWLQAKKMGHGPYRIAWLAYQTASQFLELLSFIKSLGDQVHSIVLDEPPGIQIQDFIRQPFKQHQISKRGDFPAQRMATAYWQARICDVAGCVQKTRLPGESVRFNLRLSDPIVPFLDEKAPWRGVSGDYIITFGPESRAVAGQSDALPTLTASVGAFTRLWLGVRPATGLAISDALAGPDDLLARLDSVLCLPIPQYDWDF